MTLLVGVLCADGVVLGADSGATVGAFGQSTVMVPVSTKIDVIDNQALIAVSGPFGLGQMLAGEFEFELKQGRLKGRSDRVMGEIRAAFWKRMKPEWEAAQVAGATIGMQAASRSVVSTTLLAMKVGGTARLFSFDHQAAPEEVTAKIPVVSAGAGQHNADMLLAFLRGVYWEEGHTPSLAEGLFITLWAIEQCIAVAPAGLQGPPRIFTLVMESGKPVARQLPNTELDEHRQAIAHGKAALREARGPTAAPAPPKPA